MKVLLLLFSFGVAIVTSQIRTVTARPRATPTFRVNAGVIDINFRRNNFGDLDYVTEDSTDEEEIAADTVLSNLSRLQSQITNIRANLNSPSNSRYIQWIDVELMEMFRMITIRTSMAHNTQLRVFRYNNILRDFQELVQDINNSRRRATERS